jgi:hypothetical protein
MARPLYEANSQSGTRAAKLGFGPRLVDGTPLDEPATNSAAPRFQCAAGMFCKPRISGPRPLDLAPEATI